MNKRGLAACKNVAWRANRCCWPPGRRQVEQQRLYRRGDGRSLSTYSANWRGSAGPEYVTNS